MTTLTAKSTFADLAFWTEWVVGSALGWLSAFLIFFYALSAWIGDPDLVLAEDSLAFAVYLAILFAAAGAGVGLVQALLLRTQLPGRVVWPWLIGSAAGFVTVAILSAVIPETVNSTTNSVLHNIAGGLVAAFIQLRVLRRTSTRAWLWAPASAIGFLTAAWLSNIIVAVGGDESVGELVGIAAMAALTGITLLWIMGCHEPEG